MQEIRSLVPKEKWNHCPGLENPADIATRNSDPAKLNDNSRWFKGPEWLRGNENEWPERHNTTDLPEDCLKEIRSTCKEITNMTLLIEAVTQINISNLLDATRFSSYMKLLRVTAYVLRFVKNCKDRCTNRKELTAEELDKAEMIWIRDIQAQIGQKHLSDVEKHLDIFIDEDKIIRCQGRLKNSCLKFETRHPVLLPREHHITSLIIWECHKNVLHNGTNQTLQELRTRFWIVKGRQLVKKTIYKCKLCKKLQGLSYGMPQQSQLPRFRVEDKHPFTTVGVDFAGPLYAKNSSGTNQKVCVAFFTCGISRAVHIELVSDLSVESFLLCFRRFIGRRGMPEVIVTDNAKTFTAFSKTLKRVLQSSDAQVYLAQKGVKWIFNLAKAPWWGGFYERLIKSTKFCLRKCIGKASLSVEELQTVLIEIENVLNSRPLTYLYPESLEEPLTPSHLLTGRRTLQFRMPCRDDEEECNQSDSKLRRRATYLGKLLNHYHRRWKSEYLVNLREQHRTQKLSRNPIMVNEGDIVLIEGESLKNRVFWKLGKIQNLIVGEDNVVRGARLLQATGTTIDRPIQKVYPLEVQSETSVTDSDTTSRVKEKQIRPKRKAAAIAEESLKIIDQFESEHMG